MAKNCIHCNQNFEGNFCSNCGQPEKLKRIDKHYVSHEIQHLFHIEKGILYTAKELLLRPGLSIREFISENRNKLMKPIPFLIITSLIFSLVAHFFHIESAKIDTNGAKGEELNIVLSIKTIVEWIENHYGYSNILMGGFIAFWVRLFFKKYNFNFFEITVLLCFIMGEAMLFLVLPAFFQGITKIEFLKYFAFLGIIYCVWAIAQFFEGKTFNYFKAFFAYMFGYITFYLSAILIGVIIFLIKHK